MCFVHTWTPDCPHTQSTQMGRLSLRSTSATPKTNLVSTQEEVRIIKCFWFPRYAFHYWNTAPTPLIVTSYFTSSWCFSSCVPFCINSHRCYQGEPLLHPPKQHHSTSLPAHLPGTYLQSTQGDSKNNFLGSYKTACALILPIVA